MQEGARGIRLAIAGYERVMEGTDMRASVLTLAAGECVPWLYHSTITDSFVCLEGPMEVETRAPRAVHRLTRGQRCEVAPKTAHTVHGVNGGPAGSC
jgi:quercetin dioxygenase-like cupin family protein